MHNTTIVLKQMNVRGVGPLQMTANEFDAMVIAMLSEGDGLVSERLQFFACPDCHFSFLGSHELKTWTPDDPIAIRVGQVKSLREPPVTEQATNSAAVLG